MKSLTPRYLERSIDCGVEDMVANDNEVLEILVLVTFNGAIVEAFDGTAASDVSDGVANVPSSDAHAPDDMQLLANRSSVGIGTMRLVTDPLSVMASDSVRGAPADINAADPPVGRNVTNLVHSWASMLAAIESSAAVSTELGNLSYMNPSVAITIVMIAT